MNADACGPRGATGWRDGNERESYAAAFTVPMHSRGTRLKPRPPPSWVMLAQRVTRRHHDTKGRRAFIPPVLVQRPRFYILSLTRGFAGILAAHDPRRFPEIFGSGGLETLNCRSAFGGLSRRAPPPTR